jgi:hypothetical protein
MKAQRSASGKGRGRSPGPAKAKATKPKARVRRRTKRTTAQKAGALASILAPLAAASVPIVRRLRG